MENVRKVNDLDLILGANRPRVRRASEKLLDMKKTQPIFLHFDLTSVTASKQKGTNLKKVQKRSDRTIPPPINTCLSIENVSQTTDAVISMEESVVRKVAVFILIEDWSKHGGLKKLST
ncbi:hypothetical protein CAEBREN_30165 [Caenorhabditis brenneri]|uniref:Uncharacterized protein n=1 Tax=Caenorhabditis brenneri TaxID=135651 RepID=G0PGG5_CAEBE|nr:hypothetical protein CAEBREN_30165 [Caenorhabditis brenneri]